MGLQRKEGEVIQQGQQFDIRGTIDEFRHSVNMYILWKPGMDIYVSHVRREQIPCYVFPDGYKPSRALRLQQRKQSSHIDHGCSSGSASAGRQLNKEFDEADVQGSVEKCEYRASSQDP